MAARYLLPILAFLLTQAALAQSAGEVVWKTPIDGFATMSQPRVAPDGTIYVVTDRLYAIAPNGEVLWTAPAKESYVDLGPDGTIYTAGNSTVYAYDPDGKALWQFTDPDGTGITTGPTVGPDGNVYAVSIQGGLGVFSLTPDGDLRWNVPGFLTDDGPELGRVAFGPDNVYYADYLLLGLGCDDLYTGLVSISLDGELEWCRDISGIEDPPVGVQATLDGRAVVIRRAVPGAGVYAYTPDSSLDWAYTQPAPNVVGVGPDNNLYAWFGTTLISLTADGDERWSEAQPINNFPWRAEVSPDVSAVVAGSVYGSGINGTIVTADPADGSTLWSLPVTGPYAGAGAPAEFSPDGSIVYVPVNTLSFDVPDELWAIRVHDAPPQPVTVEAAPVSPPVVIGAGGGVFSYTVTLTNLTAEPQAVQAWTAVTGPVNRDPVFGPQTVGLAPGATVTRTLTQRVPGNAPAGTYTYTVYVGPLGGAAAASASFPFTKQAGAAPRGTDASGDWAATGWDAATSSALPGGFVISDVTPNPSGGRARLTLEVAEAQAVRVEVYDGLGRRVAVLLNGAVEAGQHTLTFDGAALPTGVYVVRAVGETSSATRRATLIR